MFKHFLEKIMNERDEVNMCKALEDMKASAKQEERELDIPEEDILRKIEEKYQLAREEAVEFVKK